MNIDNSNVPRYMDLIPISDISTGDRMAQVLIELYRNVNGHQERLTVYVDDPGAEAPADPADPSDDDTFVLPRWLAENGTPADITAFHTDMRAIRANFAAIGSTLREIFVRSGLAI